MSQGGDRFGLRRGGLTLRRLTEQHPHGVVVAPHIRTGVLRDAVAYLSRRIRLVHPDIAAEVDKLSRSRHPEGYPLRMIGMREPRSENSWMHNSPLLMRGERGHRALMHVDDAAELQIADGDVVRVSLAVRPDHRAGDRDEGPDAPAWSPFRTAGATRAPEAGGWPTARAARTSTG